jgi:hypothetical protein
VRQTGRCEERGKRSRLISFLEAGKHWMRMKRAGREGEKHSEREKGREEGREREKEERYGK